MKLGRKRTRKLWFEEPIEPREQLAKAFDELPLTYLALPVRARLALSRHFGRYHTVADLMRADEEIRHVRNLGTKSLLQLDSRLRAVMAAASADERAAEDPVAILRAVQSAPMAVMPIEALSPDGYAEHPWFTADPAAREAIAVRYDALPIAAWGLSNRSRNALTISRRYRTVGAVLRADSDIRACRGLGRTTLGELHARAVAVFAGADPSSAAQAASAGDSGATTAPPDREERP